MMLPKRLIAITLFAALTIASANTLRSQWVQTNGPGGGSVLCLALCGNNLFVSVDYGGLYRTTDNGGHWIYVGAGLPNYPVYALSTIGSCLFAGSYGGGVYRSTDSGENWTKTGLTNVACLAVKGTTLFAGDAGSVNRSVDSGHNWTRLTNGLYDYLTVSVLAVLDSTLFASAQGVAIYRSTDNGASWSEDSCGYSVQCFAVIGKYVLAGTNRGVCRATTDDTIWHPWGVGLGGTIVNTLEVMDTLVFAGTDSGVYRSTDRGETWAPLGSDLVALDVRAVAAEGTNLFVGTYRKGLYRSANNGATWSLAGLPVTCVNALAVCNGNLLAGASGVMTLAADGMNWIQTSQGKIPQSVSAFAGTDSNLFAGSVGGGVFHSTDAGTTWTSVDSGLTDTVVLSLAVLDSNVFVGTEGGFCFQSTDDGSSWTQVLLTYSDIQALALNDSNLYVGTSQFGLTRYDFSTSSWSRGLGSNDVRALVTGPGIVVAGTYGGGIFRSTNNGDTWAAANKGLTTLDISTITLIDTLAFAGSFGGGIFFSTNSGISWKPANAGLTDSFVYSIAVLGSNVYLGTRTNGVWRRPLSEMITPVEAASDTQRVQFADMGFVNITLAGDSAKYRTDRIDLLNSSGVPLVVANIALTSSNQHFAISQLLPGVPDTVRPGATFSMIVHFYGDTSGTLFKDTIVLTVDHALSSFYVCLNGHSFSSARSGVSQGAKPSISEIHSYPNPFSQSTTISFTPETSGYVEVSIVNLLGVEVARIFSGELATGEHTFTWDASASETHAPQGVYECLIWMNGRVETLPVMLLR